MAAAQSWIAENYAAPNPVAGMTGISGLATRTFKRRFEAATDYTALDYVQSLRIEEAKQMLRGGAASMPDVAVRCGFTSVQYLYTVFARELGCTPRVWQDRVLAGSARSPHADQ